MKITSIITFALLISFTASAQSSEYSVKVEARTVNSEKKTFGEWKTYPARTVQTLEGYQPKEVKLSMYGGRTDRRVKATGFFYTTKINGRWWTVDPDGYLFINIALNNVATGGSERAKGLLHETFGTTEQWAAATHQTLVNLGYNSLGAWSNNEAFQKNQLQASKPLSYCIIKGFMSDFGKKLGGTYQLPGHTGYPDRTIFVFHPDFPAFCEEYAKSLAAYKDDRNLFGYFSDNEMPFDRITLDRFLRKKDTTDYGTIAAKKWLRERNITDTAAINDSIRHEFLGYMTETYFSIVSKAIKKYDPNHMYLGSRFHSYEKKVPQVFKAVGKYVDVIAVNYYREWQPTEADIVNWEKWSGKPFVITEWYTKGEDSKMPNYSGAGWEVRTQEDRGVFYQNFTLKLLESKNCIGFHWFKYQDNDTTNLKTDPSNRDANKGIVNMDFQLYIPLTEKMKELNRNVYSIIDFLDRKNQIDITK